MNLAKYLIKWENYDETTWEPEDNIPAIFRNYYNKTGKENIPQPRIKHSKTVGKTVYHLLSWEDETLSWEKDEAFNFQGGNNLEQEDGFTCHTQKVYV